MPALIPTAIWGLAIVACFSGWGGWLKRRLAPTLDVDWGLRAAWGLAVTLAAGGLFWLLALARKPLLFVWVFGGIALTVVEVVRAGRDPWLRGWRRLWRWETPALLGLLVVGGVLYIGSTGFTVPNPSDDWLAYLPFIKMLHQTGTVIDPFNVRRMASYGGQTHLQALSRLVAGEGQIQSFDQGIGLLLACALVLGAVRNARSGARLVGLMLVTMILMLPEVRINSASEVSGLVACLALHRSIVLADTHPLPGWRGALLIALPAAAFCTLRQNYIAVTGIMLLALLLPGGDLAWPARRRRFLLVAGLVAVALLPWAAAAYRSNHSPLFPLFSGYYDPNYAGMTAPASWHARFQLYRSAIFYPEPIAVMPLLLLLAPLLARGAQRRALLGLWGGAIVGLALVTFSLPDAEEFSIARYGFAFVAAFAVASGLAAADRVAASPSRRDFVVVAVTLFAVTLQIHDTRAAAARNLGVALDRMTGADPNHPPLQTAAATVTAMQRAVPAGAPLLVMIERPYLLDYDRNPITHLDQPGAASPPPGIPLAAGGEAVARYLLAAQIRYFAFTRPDRAEIDIYRRAHWQRMLTGRTRIWRLAAPSFLATFDAIDELARTRRALYDDGHLIVVDLAS